MILAKCEVCHLIRLASGVWAAGAGAHDDVAGSTQVLRQALRRHPGGEIPAAATRQSPNSSSRRPIKASLNLPTTHWQIDPSRALGRRLTPPPLAGVW